MEGLVVKDGAGLVVKEKEEEEVEVKERVVKDSVGSGVMEKEGKVVGGMGDEEVTATEEEVVGGMVEKGVKEKGAAWRGRERHSIFHHHAHWTQR